ncbi:MAG: AAA family ATPase, partial [bacterium]|nr:AAA family ATPase [bacterium]
MAFRLEKIDVHNYKSFSDAAIKLDDFNIICGANNAGKSNFIDVLEFLQLVVRHDVIPAVKLKGGFEKLVNFKSAGDCFEVTAFCSDLSFSPTSHQLPNGDMVLTNHEDRYVLSIKVQKDKRYRTSLTVHSSARSVKISKKELPVYLEAKNGKEKLEAALKSGTVFNIEITAVKEVDEIPKLSFPIYPTPDIPSNFLQKKILRESKYKSIAQRTDRSSGVTYIEGILENSINIDVVPADKKLPTSLEHIPAVLRRFFKWDVNMDEKLDEGKIAPAEFITHIQNTAT